MPNGHETKSALNKTAAPPVAAPATNFIRNIIDAELAANKFATRMWAGKPGLAGDHAKGRDALPGLVHDRKSRVIW